MAESSRPTIFHQFHTVHTLMMSDRSMVELLRANQEMIRDVRTIDYRQPKAILKDHVLSSTEKRSSVRLDGHHSFENYLSDRIKEEKRLRLDKQSKKAVSRGPQVRGTSLQPSYQITSPNDRLLKLAKESTLESYVAARHLLTRRRIRQRQKQEEQIIRIAENNKRMEALKDLAIKNERHHYVSRKESPRNKWAQRIQLLKNDEPTQRSSIDYIPVPGSLDAAEGNSPLTYRRKLSVKKKLTQTKKQFPLQDFIQSETFRLHGEYRELAGQLKQLRSQCISILNGNSLLFEQNGTITREIASLTKIMTCILTLYLSKKFAIDLGSQIKVSRKAASMSGTSAQLQAGDRPTVTDLLHGLMLPSGNDAAFALAQHFGRMLYERTDEFRLKRDRMAPPTTDSSPSKFDAAVSLDLTDRVYSSSESNVECFVKEMNSMAQHLRLDHTKYSNPHGLPDRKNRSSSNDLALLCYHAIKNPDFQRIVRTREYRCEVFNSNTRLKRQACWINTNKLLELEHCEGIKTGITASAGPCMASAFSKDGQRVIIVILKTNSLSNRFREAAFLFDWSLEKIRRTTASLQCQSENIIEAHNQPVAE